VDIKRKAGRPVSGEDKRQLIEKVARKAFASVGYDKTTIRLVAENAGVDPKLVMHYFGNKQKLFVATMKFPTQVGKGIKLLAMAPDSKRGELIAELFLAPPAKAIHQRLVGVIRAAASEPEAAEMFRELYLRELLIPILTSIKIDNMEKRAVMLSAVFVGFVFTTEIVDLQSIGGRDDISRKRLIGSLVQTILETKL
jgi:AcrR family transcriptional regulator